MAGLVLSGIAVLLGLVLALLAVPLTVAFRVDRVEETRGQVDIRWLFGLVRFQVGIPAAGTRPRRERKPGKKIRERKPVRNTRGILKLLKESEFRRHVTGFIKDLLRAVRGRDLYLRLRVGLGDPADTGRLWAILGPVAGIAATLRSAEIHLEPEFMDPVLEVESHGEFHLVPLQFVVLAVAFAASPATLRAWSILRQRGT